MHEHGEKGDIDFLDRIVFNNKENKPDLDVHRMTHMLPKYPTLVAILWPLDC